MGGTAFGRSARVLDMMNALFSQSGQMAVLPLDEGFAQLVQATRNPVGDVFFGAVTTVGNAALIWLITAVGFWIWRQFQSEKLLARIYGRTALGLVLAMAASQLLVENVIKPFTMRPRPLMIHPDWNYLDLHVVSTSFPSGHTSWAFSAVPILWVVDRRFGIGALIFALFMGFSRIYVSAHWLTDVLAGAVVGLGVGFGCLWVVGWRGRVGYTGL